MSPRGILATVALTLLAGCGDRSTEDATPSPETPAPPAGALSRTAKHEQLLRIAENLRNGNNMYNGQAEWRRLQRIDPASLPEDKRALHAFDLGMESYKFDDLTTAIEQFTLAQELAPTVRTTFMLGLAQLQTGVRDNCIGLHNPASCVFPLAGDGIYQLRDGPEAALVTFQDALKHSPREQFPRIRWFVNLAALAVGRQDRLPPGIGFEPEHFRSDYDIGRFPDVAIEAGVAPMNLAGGSAV
ncbi:hypothetical protein K8I85_12295, partial [bacterium]|nr:hypothetical protein [bacterium]